MNEFEFARRYMPTERERREALIMPLYFDAVWLGVDDPHDLMIRDRMAILPCYLAQLGDA
jgi:hypothetical protein